jgi:hypothetical protein
MRYHKAIAITKPEADHIIARGSASLSDIVVLSHNDDWYDVRGMTQAELTAFSEDLERNGLAAQRARKYPAH